MTAPHFIEALTARQIQKTLESRMPAALATMETALSLTLPDPVGFWFGILDASSSPPGDLFNTPSIGIGIGGSGIEGTGDATGSYETDTIYELTVALDDSAVAADDSGQSDQTLTESTSAYLACVWQALTTYLEVDARGEAVTTNSLGEGIPIILVRPIATGPVESVRAGENGPLLYLASVQIEVTQYQHMGSP